MSKQNHKRAPKPGFYASLRASGELELLVYDIIGEDWYGDGITAKSFKSQIDAAGTYSSITVRINSPGGDAFEGVAIGNILRSQGKPVNVIIEGIAASSASIIAMAGNTISMFSNAMMMIHNAWTFCYGDAAEMRKQADVLDAVSQAIGRTYVDRTGKTADEIKALMDAETWMSADQCVADGFATSVIPPAEQPAVQENALNMARKFKALAKLKNLPESLKAKADMDDECECECQPCMDGDCMNCSNADCMDPNCIGCPMQSGEEAKAESNLSLYQARFAALKMRG